MTVHRLNTYPFLHLGEWSGLDMRGMWMRRGRLMRWVLCRIDTHGHEFDRLDAVTGAIRV